MFKLLSIFTLLLALSIYSVGAMAAPRAHLCKRLLSVDDESYSAVNAFLVSKKIKNQLMDQTIVSEKMKKIIIEYGQLLDDLYTERFSEIAAGRKRPIPYQALGFQTIPELRRMKETVLSTHIQLLAMMEFKHVDARFKEVLFESTERIFYSEMTKYELLLLQAELLSIKQYYSRM